MPARDESENESEDGVERGSGRRGVRGRGGRGRGGRGRGSRGARGERGRGRGGERGRGRGGGRGRGQGSQRGRGRGQGSQSGRKRGQNRGVSSAIPWQLTTPESDTPPPEPSFGGSPGPRLSLPNEPQPIHFLGELLTSDIIGIIVTETNR